MAIPSGLRMAPRHKPGCWGISGIDSKCLSRFVSSKHWQYTMHIDTLHLDHWAQSSIFRKSHIPKNFQNLLTIFFHQPLFFGVCFIHPPGVSMVDHQTPMSLDLGDVGCLHRGDGSVRKRGRKHGLHCGSNDLSVTRVVGEGVWRFSYREDDWKCKLKFPKVGGCFEGFFWFVNGVVSEPEGKFYLEGCCGL